METLMQGANTESMITADARRLQAHRAIEIIAGLPDNWNDNGAPSIPADVVSRGYDILARLQHIPAVTPTAMPGIQLDFRDDNGDYIEFELRKNGTVEMYFRDACDSHGMESVITDEEVPSVVQRFYDRTL